MSVVLFHSKNDSLKALVRATVIALAPAIKRAIDAKRVQSFDEKLQRSYFLVGKK